MLRAAYGDGNYERLVDVKTKTDPENFFRLNQNIRPKIASAFSVCTRGLIRVRGPSHAS